MRHYIYTIIPLIWLRKVYALAIRCQVGKMRLLVLLSLISINSLFAQAPFCGTEATPEQIAYMTLTRESRQRFQITEDMSREVSRIPVQAHIVTRSDGSGGVSVEMVEQQLAGTNAYFQAANMEFFLCAAPNYINSDTYYDFDYSEESAMTAANNRANIINMYFVNEITADGRPLCGYAYFPGGADVVVMDNECVNPEVLAHELGHYFSLYHTHGKSNCGETDELADGSNCSTAGDDVCDTPADPNLGGPDCSNQLLDENCSYTGTATDANGQAYTPLTNNIMSYGRQSCWVNFTSGQIARLVYSLQNDRGYLTCGSTSTVCEQAVSTISCGETVDASTVGKASTFNEYCNETNGYTGPENAYKLDWTGGPIEIALTDIQEDLDILLLSACDPTACLNVSTEGGTSNELISLDLAAGTYYIMVEGWDGAASSYKLSVNNPVDGCSQSQLPDYQPTVMTGPISAMVGESIEMQVTLKNNGSADGLGNGGKDKYYISSAHNLTRSNLEANATLLQVYDTDNIAAGETKQYPGGITIPTNISTGAYFIYFYLDADNTIQESNEDNNIITHQITITRDDPYCEAEGHFGTGADYITSVSLNTISNTSEKTPYSDFTSQSTALKIGGTYTLEIGLFYSFPLDAAYGWIDFNQNNVFDASELISMSGFNSEHKSQGTFTVPSDAVLGSTRLRVRNIYADPPMADPCGTYAGEVEDYTIVIEEQEAKPDYEPTNFVARGGITTLPAGGTLVIDLKVNNNGPVDGFGNGGKDKYYLNSTPDLTGTPAFLREFGTADISANNSFEVNSGPLEIPAATTPGNYYIVFFHDADDKIDESNEDNNIAYLQITVSEEGTGPSVDFTVDNTAPCAGETVQFTSTTTGIDAGNVIAYYPLTNDLNDATGNNRPIILQGDPPPSPPTTDSPVCVNGIRANLPGGQEFSTPIIGGFDPSNFSVSLAFKVNDYGQPFTPQGVGNPIIMGGHAYRFIGIYLDGSGKVGIKYNNSNYSFSNMTISLNQWYTGEIKFQNQTATLYIDGNEIHSVNTGVLNTGNNYNFLTGDYNNGQAFNGCVKNLKIGGTPNGSNTTYNWSFPGGTPSSSTEANPTVIYATPGSYDVMLTVTEGSRSATETKVAYVKVQGCEPDWPITKTGDNHTVLVASSTEVVLDGQTVAEGDYLGAFYDDNGTLKCAGKIKWTSTNMAIIVYSDDPTTTGAKEGFGIGETLRWKLWKASTNQEIDVVASYEEPGNVITHKGQFAVNGLSRIKRLTEGTLSQMQTITLQPGWNLISSYIQPINPDMGDVFSAISSQLTIVKDETGTSYIPSSAINNIGNWNVVEGYQVKVAGNTPVDLTMTGLKADPAFTPVDLSRGWNLIPYLRESAQNIATALNPITNEIHIAKNIDGQVYMPALGINNIGNMEPGQGYWVKMNSDISLNYTARMSTPPVNMHTAQMRPERYRMARRGSQNATMILDTKGLVDFGEEVGVFDAAGNLVGAATYEEHILAFTIWGDDPSTDKIDGLEEGAEFEIRAWDKVNRVEKVFAFHANVDLYTTNGVIEVELLRITNTASLIEANSLKLYPNPTRNQATLSLNLKSQATVEVALFDLAGKQVLQITTENKTAGNHEWKINTTSLPSGLYHCKVLVDGITHNIPFSVVK